MPPNSAAFNVERRLARDRGASHHERRLDPVRHDLLSGRMVCVKHFALMPASPARRVGYMSDSRHSRHKRCAEPRRARRRSRKQNCGRCCRSKCSWKRIDSSASRISDSSVRRHIACRLSIRPIRASWILSILCSAIVIARCWSATGKSCTHEYSGCFGNLSVRPRRPKGRRFG